jgi:hypothetical protein
MPLPVRGAKSGPGRRRGFVETLREALRHRRYGMELIMRRHPNGAGIAAGTFAWDICLGRLPGTFAWEVCLGVRVELGP